VRLAKAHGLGNDFLLVAAADVPEAPASWARRLCDRHRGVGADGILAHALRGGGIAMRLINADGSDAEISGNGLRCLAAYAVSRGWLPASHDVLTTAGPRHVDVEDLGGGRFRVATDLGAPRLASAEIPCRLDPPRALVLDHPLAAAGRRVQVTATSLGNPHCAVFLDEPPDDAEVALVGPALESHAFFPQRTNVEFVSVTSRGELRVRFWERGVGPTSASGTGAASAAVAAMLHGFVDRSVRVVCDGGALDVEWPEGGSVRQVGEVELLFEAEWLLASGADRRPPSA
jgi:diaminopimelate epimerase